MDRLESVLGTAELLALQALARSTLIAEPVRRYIVAVTRATREHADIRLGGSTRSALGLQAASQALAACRGRDYVLPDDVKAAGHPGALPPHHPQDRSPPEGAHRRPVVLTEILVHDPGSGSNADRPIGSQGYPLRRTATLMAPVPQIFC